MKDLRHLERLFKFDRLGVKPSEYGSHIYHVFVLNNGKLECKFNITLWATGTKDSPEFILPLENNLPKWINSEVMLKLNNHMKKEYPDINSN